MNYVICILIGYLLGTFNPAYLIGRYNGFDIREKGTHNPGASNVKITLGWKYGIITGVVDIIKASIAVLFCRYLFPDLEVAGILGGAACVFGHMYPFYLKFKGGKGYASYTGMMLAIDWKIALLMIIIGILITVITNYIALATITTVIYYPIRFWYLNASTLTLVILCILGIIIIYKHRINIVNILNGKEIGLRPSAKKKE